MFKNKVVLVTGGSSGIGAATAELFSKEGAAVAIVGRNDDKLNKVAIKCATNGSQVIIIKADISRDEETDLIIKQTIERFGKLDILINNAGILGQVDFQADNFLNTFDEVMNVNIRGPVRITQHALPYLIKSKGNIVNVSSVAGSCTSKFRDMAYGISKAALNHFTRSCALEVAKYGVRVNSVSPGPVYTNIFEGLPIDPDTFVSVTALHRVSESQEIADLIMYLASDKAKSITGADYIIDNGVMLT